MAVLYFKGPYKYGSLWGKRVKKIIPQFFCVYVNWSFKFWAKKKKKIPDRGEDLYPFVSPNIIFFQILDLCLHLLQHRKSDLLITTLTVIILFLCNKSYDYLENGALGSQWAHFSHVGSEPAFPAN